MNTGATLPVTTAQVLQAIKTENAASASLPRAERKPLTSAKLERILNIDHVAMNAHLAILARKGLIREDFGWQTVQ